MQFQRGGTIVGFIIGVLVGLGAALAVAVYVTKVPIPFVQHGQVHTPEQDAAELQKNKDWDPNAALAGKPPVRPASAASAPARAGGVVGVGQATGPANAQTSKPDTKAAAKGDAQASSSDPLGDLARARSGMAAPAAATAAAGGAATGGADPFTYFVQAGAYRTPQDAETQRAKLSMLGMDAKVTEREQAGRTVYRVRVGPFDKKDAADQAKEKLDAAGNDTALVRIQR